MSKKDISNTQLERCYLIAKKILRHFDIDPNLLDQFSKKQKQILLRTIFDTPSLKPEKENSIPRQYVEKIRQEVFNSMKTEYFGKPDNQLSYMELATCGLGFFISVLIHTEKGLFTGTPQEEIAKQIETEFRKVEIFKEGFNEILEKIHFMTQSYSQVNFRLYGFSYDWKPGNAKILGGFSLQMKVRLTVQNCESKFFTYHNIERKAFRLILTANGIYEPSWAVIKAKRIFPEADENKKLNIYIQSHVLHRFKERMDLFEPHIRNYLIQYALTNGQLVVSTEKQKYLACAMKDFNFGYFTFFVQGDDIVVNTFIPLVSEYTPEGKKLHELLSLSKEDMIYLGMDKLSFYTKVDFEKIPILKQALIDADLWKTKLGLDDMLVKAVLEEGESSIDMQKTLFVKNFFDKYQQYRTQTENETDEIDI